MKIEIRKAGFVNKGAELMLLAIQQEISTRYPNAEFVMEPRNRMAPYKKRAQAGLYQKFKTASRKQILVDLAVRCSPRWRQDYGIVLDKEIDAVLDAAGFAYGDQFGAAKTVELAQSVRRWKSQGSKVILLPQAFGPFTGRDIRAAMGSVINHADLIFARDSISYDHLIGISGERKNIRLAPDFTNLIKGICPQDFDLRNHICIIPNNKMIEKTSTDIGSLYVPFLTSCVQYLKLKNQDVFFLVHEGREDKLLAEQVSDATGGVPIIQEEDPLKVKGIISICTAVISSRFHGIVSALSQGIPALATGWSHKYRMLFDDYRFPEGLIDLRQDESLWKAQIDRITNSTSNEELRNHLSERAIKIKRESEDMWKFVFSILDNIRE